MNKTLVPLANQFVIMQFVPVFSSSELISNFFGFVVGCFFFISNDTACRKRTLFWEIFPDVKENVLENSDVSVVLVALVHI